MSNFSYKEIKEIISYTPEELKGVQISTLPGNIQLTVGYFSHIGTNWSYVVHSLFYKNQLINVATVFDEIR